MGLTDIPPSFDIDSEEEVRFAVAKFFSDLGFEPDEMSFEDHFSIQLGHSRFKRENDYRNDEPDRARGYSDILLIYNDVPLAIVEVKHLEHELTDDDAWQAISYARLLRRRVAPYAIVTNGRDTKVYDPLADSDDPFEIELPSDAMWEHQGRSVSAINDDLRHEAARKIVGINPDTLQTFCHDQVQAGIEDLKGNAYELKQYVPELYLPRAALSDEFTNWLQTDLPVFAVVADSGVGKTNFMCATAERAVADNFVLFYPAQRMFGGLVASIANDFLWEFRRDLNIAHIVERFSDLAKKHGEQLIIFIDALDEYIGEENELKAELIDFVRRIDGQPVKLCVSCKAYDWEYYVIDSGRSYNRLARLAHPQGNVVQNPTGRTDIDAENVGFWLDRFSESELDTAFARYREVYSLTGELRGETRTECELPLMLRIAAEVYADREAELPAAVSSRRLWNEFLERKLGRMSNRVTAELIMSCLAEILVRSGRRYVSMQEFAEQSSLERFSENAFHDLIRLGLVTETRKRFGVRQISFRFEKLRSYVFGIHVMSWTSKAASDVASEIIALLGQQPNQLSVEAVEFFLTVVDRGETEILTELALADLQLFEDLIDTRDGTSIEISPLNNLEMEARFEILVARLRQYARAYSEIAKRYFPELRLRIPPYTDRDIGVWVNRDPFMYQLRACTEEYPQPIVFEPEDMNRLLDRVRLTSPAVFRALGKPTGTIQFGLPDLSSKLPHHVAWERLLKEIIELLKNGLLDESPSQAILQERSREILFREPGGWPIFVRDEEDEGQNFQRLGFDSVESVYDAPLEDLIQRVDDAISTYLQRAEEADTRPVQQWFLRRFEYFYVLRYWFSVLQERSTHLARPILSGDEILATIKDPEATVAVFDRLVPSILNAYRSIVRHNFSGLAPLLELNEHDDRPLLVEVTFRGDSEIADIRYVLLKTVDLDVEHLVYWRSHRESLANQELVVRKTLRGSTWMSSGGRFGRAALSLTVNGRHIQEPEAVIYRTRFPSRPTIANQVYQLITAEAEKLLRGASLHWSIDGVPRFESGELTEILTQASV